MKLRHSISTLLLFALAACGVTGPEHVQKEGDWQVMVTHQGKPDMLCYAGAAPIKSEGSAGERESNPYLMVTRRNSGKIEISASSGYAYKRGSKVELAIDDETYSLFFKDKVAWARSDGADHAIIEAMADTDNETAKLHGLSKSGGTSVDIYSLNGFAKALEHIRELCP